MRIDDVLIKYGHMKKSEVKKIVKHKWVTVDDKPVSDINFQVDSQVNDVKLDGVSLSFPSHRYYMVNKAIRTLSANRDADLPVVFDMFPPSMSLEGLYIIGRLDFLSEGLVLITDNGKLGRNLLKPEAHIEKVYEVVTKEKLSEAAVEQFASGMIIDRDVQLAPATLVLTSNHTALVTISEGKNRQIRKMFLSIGVLVTRLVRKKIGPITLDDNLLPGTYRELSQAEVAELSRYFN